MFEIPALNAGVRNASCSKAIAEIPCSRIVTKGECILIKRTAYIFLVIYATLNSLVVPCLAMDGGDNSAGRLYGDISDYDRRQRDNRARRDRKDAREDREEEERRKEEKADEMRRDNKFRSDKSDEGSEAVKGDDMSFAKRKTLDDGYDGSQFNSPDFAGADFHKSTFDDLDRDMRKFDKRDDDDKGGRGDRLLVIDEMDKPGARLDDDRKRARKIFEDLAHSGIVMPGSDWAPSALDPTNNGGFGSASDNGAPVPFKLNGHVDPQRKPAWQSAD